MNTNIFPVPLAGHTMFVGGDEAPLVALRPVAQALGVAWQVQHRKLTTHPTFAPCVTIMVTRDTAGREQDMLAMPADMVVGWLLTIHPDKVDAAIRETLIAFQRGMYRAAYDAWTAGRMGLPTHREPGQRLDGMQIERIEGPPRMHNHPVALRAIAQWEAASRIEADASEASRPYRAEARRLAASIGLSSGELKQLVDRVRTRRAMAQRQLEAPANG